MFHVKQSLDVLQALATMCKARAKMATFRKISILLLLLPSGIWDKGGC